MCKFCEESEKIETAIGNMDLFVYLDDEDKRLLNIKLPFINGVAVTRPIAIDCCPFCGKDLDELNCKDCFNYNIGDGIDGISQCEGCSS